MKREYYCKPILEPIPVTPAIPCFMTSSSSKLFDPNYEDEYPLLSRHTTDQGVTSSLYLKPTTVKVDCSVKPLTAVEEALNWQTSCHVAHKNHLIR